MMNTEKPFSWRICLLALAAGWLLTGRTAAAADALLDYRFDPGAGVTVSDRGSAGLHLTAGAALGWGASGAGVGGGDALGRVGDRDVFLENKQAGGKGLDGLRAFTVCGWYRARFLEKTQGVLFELAAAEGRGFQLHLASRKGDDGKLRYSLVSAIIPKGGNPHTGPGVLYSLWENPYAVEDEWVFYAVVLDLRDDTRMLTFYAGSANQPPQLLGGSFRKPATWTDIGALGRIEAVRMANSADLKQPVPVGFYFDDLSFYGSPKETGGALTPLEIQAVWQRGFAKKAGAR